MWMRLRPPRIAAPMAYPSMLPTMDATVPQSVSRNHLRGAAMIIGISRTNGGTGKKAESIAATTMRALKAAGVVAYDSTRVYIRASQPRARPHGVEGS